MSGGILECRNLTMRFGGLVAVDRFDETLVEGELLGLIGPNGAGKTTVFNMITGVYQPSSGDIFYRGGSIIGLKPHRITAGGIARTFQNIRLFDDLSVLDNVRLACHHRVSYGILDAVFRRYKFHEGEKEILRRSTELLELMELSSRSKDLAKNLPYGEQRRLEIARALATGPSLLMLDEPAAGMNPQEKEDLSELVGRIRKNLDLTVLLIEHDMAFVMGLCERIVVLDYGKIICRGTPKEVRTDPKVIRAYLGGSVDA